MCALDSRLARLARGIPFNDIFGPWEGGLHVADHPRIDQSCNSIPLAVVAYNVNEAFGSRSATESRDDNIIGITACLHDIGAAAAVVSEPQLAVS